MPSPSFPATRSWISKNSRAPPAGAKPRWSPLKDVQPLTGYIRGGVTVFGAKKPYPVFVDETAILFDKISVSAGTRGTQLILAPGDYLRAAAAIGEPVETADLTKDTRTEGAPSNFQFSDEKTGDWAGGHAGSTNAPSRRARK